MTKTDKINALIRQQHNIITDYHNGWLTFEEYKEKTAEIRAEINKIREGN